MAPRVGMTGVIVRVDVAEPFVRRPFDPEDPTGANDVPAHVTLLWPFVDLPDLTGPDLSDLAAIVAAQPAFDVTFPRLGRFEDVLWLAPEPAGPFAALTRAIADRWPSHPPYEGRFSTVNPHLTVAKDIDLGGAEARELSRTVEARLPVAARVDEAELIAFSGTRFEVVRRLPLGRDGTDRGR